MISGISGVNNYDYLWQLQQSGSQSGNISADEVFSKIDANGDGSISKDELSAFQSKLDAQSAGSATGTSPATSAVSNQQSQTNGIQSLLTQAISMYMQFSQLNPALSGMGSFAVTG